MNLQEKKIINTILFFANKSKDESIERLKLMKLIWLSDRLHLNKYGRLIIKDRYKALPRGPVASKTLSMSNNNNDYYEVNGFKIKSIQKSNLDFFSTSDIEIMEYVWKKFGVKNSFELENYSHLFPEWLRFENELNDDSLPNSYDMVIQDFFDTPNTSDFSDLFTENRRDLSIQDFNVHNSIQSTLRA